MTKGVRGDSRGGSRGWSGADDQLHSRRDDIEDFTWVGGGLVGVMIGQENRPIRLDWPWRVLAVSSASANISN